MRTPTAALSLLATVIFHIFIFHIFIGQPLAAQAQANKRPLQPADVYRLKTLADPQISPDGKWIAYTLSVVDSAQDKRTGDIWMTSYDGKETLQLTHTKDESERAPRWSPDGKYLSFLAARAGDKKSQIWLLERRGGEAQKITDLKGTLSDYAWSPDGKKIILVVKDANPLDTAKSKTAPPMAIHRYRFKQDREGYLWQNLRSHLYIFHLQSKKIDTLTRGDHDNRSPEWSPDGSMIAFVSNRTPDPDYNNNTDIWTIEAKAGAQERQLTTWTGSDDAPRWSPDGSKIAYLRSTASDYVMYDQAVLAVAPAKGGETALLSASLDRPASRHFWAADGLSLYALIADDRARYIANFSASASSPTAPLKIGAGERSMSDITHVSLPEKNKPRQFIAALVSEPLVPAEIFAVEQTSLRRVTNHHAEFLAPLALASVEGFRSKSSDGASSSGLLGT